MISTDIYPNIEQNLFDPTKLDVLPFVDLGSDFANVDRIAVAPALGVAVDVIGILPEFQKVSISDFND